jgi:MFS-type transporter involved in bile tolerance (Atg22 family)
MSDENIVNQASRVETSIVQVVVGLSIVLGLYLVSLSVVSYAPGPNKPSDELVKLWWYTGASIYVLGLLISLMALLGSLLLDRFRNHRVTGVFCLWFGIVPVLFLVWMAMGDSL